METRENLQHFTMIKKKPSKHNFFLYYINNLQALKELFGLRFREGIQIFVKNQE